VTVLQATAETARPNDHFHFLRLLWQMWTANFFNNVMSGERRTKLFRNLYQKPKTVSGLKVALENMGQFSADPTNTRNSAIADKPARRLSRFAFQVK